MDPVVTTILLFFVESFRRPQPFFVVCQHHQLRTNRRLQQPTDAALSASSFWWEMSLPTPSWCHNFFFLQQQEEKVPNFVPLCCPVAPPSPCSTVSNILLSSSRWWCSFWPSLPWRSFFFCLCEEHPVVILLVEDVTLLVDVILLVDVMVVVVVAVVQVMIRLVLPLSLGTSNPPLGPPVLPEGDLRGGRRLPLYKERLLPLGS